MCAGKLSKQVSWQYLAHTFSALVSISSWGHFAHSKLKLTVRETVPQSCLLTDACFGCATEAGTDVPAALSAFGYAPTKKKEHKMYGAHYKADDDMPTKKATKISFD